MNSAFQTAKSEKKHLAKRDALRERRRGLAIFEIILTLAAGITLISGGTAYYKGAELARGASDFTKSSQYLRGHFAAAAARGETLPLGQVANVNIPAMPGFTEYPDGSIQHEWTEDVRFNHQGDYVIETILGRVTPRRCKLIVSHAAEMAGGAYDGFLDVNETVFADIEAPGQLDKAMRACEEFSSADVGWVFAYGAALIEASGAYAMAYPPGAGGTVVADAGGATGSGSTGGSVGGVAGSGASGSAGSGSTGGSVGGVAGSGSSGGSGGGSSAIGGVAGAGASGGSGSSTPDTGTGTDATPGETAGAGAGSGSNIGGVAGAGDAGSGAGSSTGGVAGDQASGSAGGTSDQTSGGDGTSSDPSTTADGDCVYNPGNSSTGAANGHDKNGKNTCLDQTDSTHTDNGNHYGYSEGDGTNGNSNTTTNPNVANGNDRSDSSAAGTVPASGGSDWPAGFEDVTISSSVIGSLAATPFWPEQVTTSSFSVAASDAYRTSGGEARDSAGDFATSGELGSSTSLSFSAPSCGASTEVTIETKAGQRYILEVTRPKYKGNPKNAPADC